MKKETNISTKHNSRKNSNCREADQLAIYEHDRGPEPASTEKKFQLSVVRAGSRDLGISSPPPLIPFRKWSMPSLVTKPFRMDSSKSALV